MSDWVDLLIRMPFRLFGLGMEFMSRITSILAEATSQSGTQDAVAAGLDMPARPPALCNKNVQNYGKEEEMTDQDFGGDDLKVVRYRIIYTKRDHEAFLEDGDMLIDYRTNAGELGGLIIASFMEKVQKKQIKLPSKVGNDISVDDRRYVKVTVEVVGRFPRESGEYDRRKIQELEGIHDAITKVSSKIVP
jgi:hypothetical protein